MRRSSCNRTRPPSCRKRACGFLRAHAAQLARIRSATANPALKTAPGAHHWQLRYLEFAANQDGYGDIIQIGDGSSAQNTLSRVPHDIAAQPPLRPW